MKKNFKFMLIALLAVFGLTSASAAELVNSTQYTNDGYQYKILTLNTTAKTGTVSVSQSNWAETAADKTKITINPTITINVKGEVSGTPIDAAVVFDIVSIEGDGFKDLETITEITFAEGCKITSIGTSAFAGTKIKTLDLTNTKITTLNKLFEDANTNLEKVILNATLTEIVAKGLAHNYVLSEIDASKATALLTLGANCFGDNIVEELDLSKTVVTNLSSKPFVGAAGESGEKNKTLKKLTLPKTVVTLGTGLANLYNLKEVNLEDTKINEVGNLAFENDKALESLTFPNTLVEIKTSTDDSEVFKGCAKLAELTFDYKVLTAVGGDNRPLFAEATVGDGTLAALKTLKFITETTPDPTFKVNIGTDAFANCTGITKVEIAEGKEIAAGATLNAGAITLSDTEDSEVKLGKLSKAPEAAFIAGPTATGIKADVTVGDIAVAQAQGAAIVSGNIGTFTVANLSAALQVEAIGAAAKIVFGGNITTALTVAGTRVPNSRLTEIDFGKVAITAAMFPEAAFDEDNAPNLVKATWTPDNATAAFDKKTFGTEQKDAAKVIFTTNEAVGAKYPGNVNEPTVVDADLYNVVFKYKVTPIEAKKIEVYGPEGGNSFIGYTKATGSNYKIAKKQGDATITVFSAFIDESDNILYMDPLQIVDGNFVVKKNEVVIIRSTSSKKVEYYETDDKNTMRYTWSAQLVNDLKLNSTAISADELGTQYYDKGQFIYRLDNPKTTGIVHFNILSNTQYLPKNSVYTVRNGKAAEARQLDIVWLDGSENVTGIIESIADKKAVNNNNGVMYNLSGQKVGAGYKGIVIMNGKKMIQK